MEEKYEKEKRMQLKSTKFIYEGLVELSKDNVILLFNEYLKNHNGDTYYPQSINDCVEAICDDGYFELDDGYMISMETVFNGCEIEFWDDIK